jgi:hypothetical protein
MNEPKFKVGQEVVIPSLESYGVVERVEEWYHYFVYFVRVGDKVIEFWSGELERA